MSSKTNTTATKEEASPALVPKLRFPEFRRSEGWKSSVLAAACDMQAGKFVSASNISERNQDGLFPCYGGNGLRGYTATHTHNGTYPLIGRQGALCGNVRLVSGQFHATEHAVVATPKQAVDVGWLYYSLDLLKLNQFATGQAQPGLSVDVLENVVLAISPLEAEQQKIAECLSSVDELMTAQARKVDALKTHKKGLMQQLFPREGETQPRLRFPEFRDAGEWEESPLSRFILSLDAGVSVNSGDSRPADKTEFGVLKTSAITKGHFDPEENKVVLAESELSRLKEPVTGGTIIMCRKNTPALVGASAYVESSHENLFLPDLLWAAKPREGVSMRFLSCILGSDKGRAALSKLAKGSSASMSNITKPEVLAFSVMAPSAAEQQRIATCLSSLDALIAAETQKLEALKTHKKGLMQQLFPSMEEVEA